MSALRDDLLAGLGVALAPAPVCDPLSRELERLGAVTHPIDARPDDEPGAWSAQHGPLHALVFDATAVFGHGGDERLMAMLEAVWAAALELATELIASARPGKLVLLAPAPSAGPLAAAAADALENLARTLSIEWARHGITTCAIARSDATSPQQVAELVAYVLSPAGDYVTGCRLTLGAVAQAPRAGSSAQGTITASS